MSLQDEFNGLMLSMQRERATTQMTLGKLIAALEAMPGNAKVKALHQPHSYRGYYMDLAFEHTGESTTAKQLLAVCRWCMGKMFYGYKGGEFVMGELTPVWIAMYGHTGERIISIRSDGTFETAEEQF